MPRPEIDRFLKLFPDDDRFEEVDDMRMSLDLAAVVRRLRLQAKLELTPLAAHEQAFLDAMNLRETDSMLAQERLRQVVGCLYRFDHAHAMTYECAWANWCGLNWRT